jgi:hypothetical protein
MSPVSHQTIKLSKGKHTSPDEGACVMELASMLAGEPFTDHPMSACPVIGSFLRAYNDSVDDDRRQDLYAYAARVVGSRGSESVQRARAERLLAWAAEMQRRRVTRFLLPPALRALGRRRPPIDAVGSHAVHAIPKHTDETHAAVLGLLDTLLAIDAHADAVPTEGPLEPAAPPVDVAV